MESSKIGTLLRFYGLATQLKTLVRSGWKVWHAYGVEEGQTLCRRSNEGWEFVQFSDDWAQKRLESVAEHTFGTLILAIAVYSEYPESYAQIKLDRVLYMLTIHELEEVFIGDIIPYEGISKTEKHARGHAAIQELLAPLALGQELEAVILEFDAHETPEAKFAGDIDKLESIIQCKLYDEDHAVDFARMDPDGPLMQLYQKQHYHTWSEGWAREILATNNFDDNFVAIAEYALENEIATPNAMWDA